MAQVMRFCPAEKRTKRSSNILLRLVRFSVGQTLRYLKIFQSRVSKHYRFMHWVHYFALKFIYSRRRNQMTTWEHVVETQCNHYVRNLREKVSKFWQS